MVVCLYAMNPNIPQRSSTLKQRGGAKVEEPPGHSGIRHMAADSLRLLQHLSEQRMDQRHQRQRVDGCLTLWFGERRRPAARASSIDPWPPPAVGPTACPVQTLLHAGGAAAISGRAAAQSCRTDTERGGGLLNTRASQHLLSGISSDHSAF